MNWIISIFSIISLYEFEPVSNRLEFKARSNLEVTSTCGQSEIFMKYECMKHRFETSFIQGEFKGSLSILNQMVLTLSTHDDYRESSITERLLAFSEKLAIVDLKFDNEHLEVKLIDGFFTVERNSILWILDTGATYGAAKLDKMVCSEYIDSDNIKGIFGNISQASYCSVYIDDFGVLPLNKSKYSNILGLVYMAPHDKMSVSNDIAEDIVEVLPIHYNGNYLFSHGNIEAQGMVYEDVNLCLDTGSEKTIFTSKFYTQIKTDIEDRPVSRIRYSTPFGEASNFIKIIDKSIIAIGNSNFAVGKIPVQINANSDVECDSILGMDVLKSISVIDFKNMTMTFSKI